MYHHDRRNWLHEFLVPTRPRVRPDLLHLADGREGGGRLGEDDPKRRRTAGPAGARRLGSGQRGRDEGVENIVEVAENGADFPGEIHPRVVWHRDEPTTPHSGFQQIMEIADPDNGAVEYIDGFVIPEVGDVDD